MREMMFGGVSESDIEYKDTMAGMVICPVLISKVTRLVSVHASPLYLDRPAWTSCVWMFSRCPPDGHYFRQLLYSCLYGFTFRSSYVYNVYLHHRHTMTFDREKESRRENRRFLDAHDTTHEDAPHICLALAQEHYRNQTTRGT